MLRYFVMFVGIVLLPLSIGLITDFCEDERLGTGQENRGYRFCLPEGWIQVWDGGAKPRVGPALDASKDAWTLEGDLDVYLQKSPEKTLNLPYLRVIDAERKKRRYWSNTDRPEDSIEEADKWTLTTKSGRTVDCEIQRWPDDRRRVRMYSAFYGKERRVELEFHVPFGEHEAFVPLFSSIVDSFEWAPNFDRNRVDSFRSDQDISYLKFLIYSLDNFWSKHYLSLDALGIINRYGHQTPEMSYRLLIGLWVFVTIVCAIEGLELIRPLIAPSSIFGRGIHHLPKIYWVLDRIVFIFCIWCIFSGLSFGETVMGLMEERIEWQRSGLQYTETRMLSQELTESDSDNYALYIEANRPVVKGGTLDTVSGWKIPEDFDINRYGPPWLMIVGFMSFIFYYAIVHMANYILRMAIYVVSEIIENTIAWLRPPPGDGDE